MGVHHWCYLEPTLEGKTAVGYIFSESVSKIVVDSTIHSESVSTELSMWVYFQVKVCCEISDEYMILIQTWNTLYYVYNEMWTKGVSSHIEYLCLLIK